MKTKYVVENSAINSDILNKLLKKYDNIENIDYLMKENLEKIKNYQF